MIVNYIDLGLHVGREISYIYDSLNGVCDLNIYGVEANDRYYNHCLSEFRDKKNIHIFNLAISDSNGQAKLYLETKNGVGSSIYKGKNNVSKIDFKIVQMVSFGAWLESIKMADGLNIIKANIEGAEYRLIKDMEKHNLFGLFDLFLGPSGSWTKDMRKIKGLADKIGEAEEILAKNKVRIMPFHINDPKKKKVDFFDVRTWVVSKMEKCHSVNDDIRE